MPDKTQEIDKTPIISSIKQLLQYATDTEYKLIENTDKKVLYITSDKFVDEYTKIFRYSEKSNFDRIDTFKDKYRNVLGWSNNGRIYRISSWYRLFSGLW